MNYRTPLHSSPLCGLVLTTWSHPPPFCRPWTPASTTTRLRSRSASRCAFVHDFKRNRSTIGDTEEHEANLCFVLFRAFDGAWVPLEAVGDRVVPFLSLSLSLTAYDLPVVRPWQVSDEKMKFYEELAEMYVGDDVSPDFYGWVFPKVRLQEGPLSSAVSSPPTNHPTHVFCVVGSTTTSAWARARWSTAPPSSSTRRRCATGARPRSRAARSSRCVYLSIPLLSGRPYESHTLPLWLVLVHVQVEAHPIPEHMRPRRVVNRAALVGDAAGYVTKCSGEGIYFAAKSGRMAGEAVSKVVKVR